MIADSFRLNGGVLRMEKSTTVLQVAHNSLVNIATHSFLEGLSIAGSYRLCNVDIQGQSQSVLAGSTIMQNGRVVDTDCERLRIQCRFVFNMLSAQGHHVCVVCVSNGHGALQTLAQGFDITTFIAPIVITNLNQVETVIRTFDLCFSYVSHTIGQLPSPIQLLHKMGQVIDEVKR